jgi:hypothetical protein
MLSDESVKRPWVNFEAGIAWTRKIPIIPVCLGGLTKDSLPKPYSSLQAVDLQQFGDDEYLAKSVAHYLGINEPKGRFYGALALLGGPEEEKKVKVEQHAYEELIRRLKEIDHLRSIRRGGL